MICTEDINLNNNHLLKKIKNKFIKTKNFVSFKNIKGMFIP